MTCPPVHTDCGGSTGEILNDDRSLIFFFARVGWDDNDGVVGISAEPDNIPR